MILDLQTVNSRTAEIKRLIEQQFGFFQPVLARSVLPPQSIQKLSTSTGEALIALDSATTQVTASNIASTIIQEQIKRGFPGDLLFSLMHRSALREQTAKIFLHEILSRDLIQITGTVPPAIYVSEVNCAFAAIMAIGQRRGSLPLTHRQAAFPVISHTYFERARRYQRFLAGKTSNHFYDNHHTSKLMTYLAS